MCPAMKYNCITNVFKMKVFKIHASAAISKLKMKRLIFFFNLDIISLH